MTAAPSELGTYSTRRLLVWRIRLIMLICAGGGVFFGGRELFFRDGATPQFWTQMLGITLSTSTFFVLRQPWVLRHAWPLCVFIVSFTYFLTGFAGMLSPTREYATSTVLFIGAAMTTAAIVPWGEIAQTITVLVGLVTLAGAVLYADGGLQVLRTDAAAATLIAFALSVVAAFEFNRYRLGHRREHLRRRRGELAIIRLNSQLEQRVVERTAQLAHEAAERIESQRRLADTVDHSNAMISLKDPNGRYLLVNRNFEAVFGLGRMHVIGRTDRELFTDDLGQRLGTRDQEVLRSGRAVSFEQELPVAGTMHAYVSVKFPLHDASGATYGVGTVATDISRVKQLQDELRRHQEELAHVLRLHTITEMAAGLAHEINQPLCAITNYAQGGIKRLEGRAGNSSELLQAFQKIVDEGLRAGDIIRGIRNLVQRTAPSGPIDVNALATEAVRLLESRARQRDVTVRLERAPELPQVFADGTQIEQVILNLMLNGVEAIDGTTSDRREVVITTRARVGGIEVAVSDTGIGIAPAVADRLFSPFVTTKTGGLGLGLAISRSIVELHGGRLWATANAGSGTTFGFWLPSSTNGEATEKVA